jgi:nucleoside-diphosphate-sugar epimerase
VIAARPDKALVIGAGGNIGGPLVRHLKQVGYEVLETDIRPGFRDGYMVSDINHPIDLLPAFDWKPDVVFLLAGAVGREVCEQAGSLALATNVSGHANVLQLCLRSGSRCVFFSSSEVYGPHDDVLDEVTSVPHPNNRYALSKWLGEQLVEYEVREHGLRAVILRLFTIYDENEEAGDHRSAMIRFASHLARGQPIAVHRGSSRGWLHVSDAVRAIEAAAQVREPAVINIGNPEIVPTADLAEMIRKELGAEPGLIHLQELPTQMTLHKRPHLERQRSLLGFRPSIPLEQGIAWVCERQQSLLAAAHNGLDLVDSRPGVT